MLLRAEMMEGTTTLRDVLVVFFKYKTMLLIVFMAIVAPVTVRAFLLLPVYEATSTFMIKFGREYLYRPEVGEGKAMLQANYSLMQEALINSELEILNSRDLKEKVIASLGLENLFPSGSTSPAQDRNPMDEAVKRFEKQLKVESIKKSSVLRVSFQHNNPSMTAKAVNVLIDLFKDKRLGVFKDPHASTFLQQQVAAYRQQLEESERRLQDFLQRHPHSSHAQQRNLLLTRWEGANTALKTTQSRIVELETKLAFLKGQMPSIAENTPVSAEPGAPIDTAKSRLLTLRLREQELLNKYKDEHPSVIGIRKEIQEAEVFLREVSRSSRVVVGKNMLHQDIKREMVQTEAELHAQESKIAVLEQQLAQVNTELQALAGKEKELSDLERERARSENNYQVYATKLEETRLLDEMDRQKIVNISMVQVATVPAEPVKPRKRLHIALGALFGAFVAVGLAFFREYIGQGLSTPESTERRLGLPVLVAVPVKRHARGRAVSTQPFLNI
jgi:uncharacterized protein involved in exopolysaccharide biosynthesis